MTAGIYERAKADTLARFKDTGPTRLNCAQSMVDFGLKVLGQDTDLSTVARYLGGGVCSMGGTCGAVTGTAVALGLRDYFRGADPDEIETTKADLQRLMRAFAQEFGSLACRELTGYDLSIPEAMEVFKASEAHDRCPIYVGWMCDRLLPFLTDDTGDPA